MTARESSRFGYRALTRTAQRVRTSSAGGCPAAGGRREIGGSIGRNIFHSSWALLALISSALGCGTDTDSGSGPSGLELLIEGEPNCTECEIQLRPVALLGNLNDPSSVAPDAAGRDCALARLGTGEFALGDVVGGGEIFVYGENGALSRRVGHRGHGPGELSGILQLAVGPGDSLLVLDNDQARLSVFSSSGAFVRSFPTPDRVRSFALLADGSLLFHRTPQRSGEGLFYLTDSDGGRSRQFGEVTQDLPELDGQVIAPGEPSGFWTASIWTYELFRQESPDSLEQKVIRTVGWFPPGGEYIDGMPFSIPSPPILKHLWDEGSGRMWVYTLVPDEAWKPQIPMNPTYEWARLSFDTVIELIDLRSGEVVASGRYDEMLGMVCGSALAFAVVESEEEDLRVQVFRPTMIQRR